MGRCMPSGYPRQVGDRPSWTGGVAARSRKRCEASPFAQTGWWVRLKNIFLDLEPPPGPLHQRKFRDISFDVASTLPGQEGRCRAKACCERRAKAGYGEESIMKTQSTQSL